MAPRTITKKQKMEAVHTSNDLSNTQMATKDPQVTDSESEVDAISQDSKKFRRTVIDPLEIKALLMQDTKGARTKAIKLLERLSKQLEKIQSRMSKKKASGPRKLSAYNVYTRQHMVDVQQLESKLRMKELGQRWKALSAEERAPYVALAQQQAV